MRIRLPRLPVIRRSSRLELELLHPGRRQRMVGSAVLVLGMLLLGILANRTWQFDRQLARQEAARRPAPAVADRPLSAEAVAEVRAIREADAQWTLPWGTLFQALENAASEHIHLIDVTPDAATGTLQIVAEAQDVYGMLDYVRDLSSQPFTGVTVTNYQLGTPADQWMRFTLTATWRRAP